jgi:hypothetical protein
MFSPDVCEMIPTTELFSRLEDTDDWTTWGQVEYNDMDFWWKPECHKIHSWFYSWFDTPNWEEYLNPRAIDALQSGKYVFYTCHGWTTLMNMKNQFPNARIMKINPNLDLCRKNLALKEPRTPSTHYPRYDPEDSYNVYRKNHVDTTSVFDQEHIYDTELFTKSIQSLADSLGIQLDMENVLKYRECYLSNRFNQI